MPCNQIVTNTVNLGKVATDHPELLEAALRTEFKDVSVRGDRIGTIHGTRAQVSEFIFTSGGARVLLKDGRATSTLSEGRLQEVVGQVNRAVSRQAIALAARRFGWAVVPGADADHFQVVKR